MTLLISINNYFFVVSVAILDVSAAILEVVSAAIGAILEVSVDIVDVESFVVSVVEEPPHAASNADVQTITSNFFILI
ncbi:MAG TPA: hypothetical protein VIJ92_00790 [Ginsengibacter sp.]